MQTLNLSNADDVLGYVLNAHSSQTQLPGHELVQIAIRLYEDRRGGTLAELWGNQEFLDALQAQTETLA